MCFQVAGHPASTVTVAFFRTWRGWRRCRRPAVYYHTGTAICCQVFPNKKNGLLPTPRRVSGSLNPPHSHVFPVDSAQRLVRIPASPHARPVLPALQSAVCCSDCRAARRLNHVCRHQTGHPQPPAPRTASDGLRCSRIGRPFPNRPSLQASPLSKGFDVCRVQLPLRRMHNPRGRQLPN